MSVHRAGGVAATFRRGQVCHDLVAVEIEVDPLVRGPAFGTAQGLSVELACNGQVMDRKSQVERAQLVGMGHAWLLCGIRPATWSSEPFIVGPIWPRMF